MPKTPPIRGPRIARLIAVVAGLAGVVLCALVPLLPVKQTTATILWPQSPTEPLRRRHGTSAADRAAGVRCAARARRVHPVPGGRDPAPRGRHWCSRRSPRAASPPAATGCSSARTPTPCWSRSGTRWRPSRRAPRWPAAAAAPCTCGPTPAVRAPTSSASPVPTGVLPADKKPQVAGVFTDLDVAAQPGLSARIDVDTRFITAPTPLKLAVMVLGVACVIASIVALAVLDRRGRRRIARAWRASLRAGPAIWLADAGVVGALLAWHVVGPQSSDDGYNLTIARIAGEAGYATNYFRYFGATEAPFDWYQSVLAHLASVSTAGTWMRLPATAAAIAHLADRQPLRAAPARQATGRQPRRGADRGRGVPGGVAAVQQRPAPRTADRLRRGRGVDARRERHRDAQTLARGGGDRHRDVLGDARTAGPHRAGAAARRGASHRAHRLRPQRGPRAGRRSWRRWPPPRRWSSSSRSATRRWPPSPRRSASSTSSARRSPGTRSSCGTTS